MSVTTKTAINIITNFQTLVRNSKSKSATKQALIEGIDNVRLTNNKEQYQNTLYEFDQIVQIMKKDMSRNLIARSQEAFVELENLVPAFTNNKKEETMATNTDTPVSMDLINELRNRLLNLEADNARLKNLLMSEGIATTYTLNRQQFNMDWLVALGINEDALTTKNGKILVQNLQIVRDGNWFKLRFTRGYFKRHETRCKKFFERVHDLAREKGHGTTVKTDNNGKTWNLVSFGLNPNAQEQTEEEPSF